MQSRSVLVLFSTCSLVGTRPAHIYPYFYIFSPVKSFLAAFPFLIIYLLINGRNVHEGQ